MLICKFPGMVGGVPALFRARVVWFPVGASRQCKFKSEHLFKADALPVACLKRSPHRWDYVPSTSNRRSLWNIFDHRRLPFEAIAVIVRSYFARDLERAMASIEMNVSNWVPS